MTKILGERYEIINPISSGGFGETFLAKDLHSPIQKKVVIKFLKSFNQNTSPEIIEKLFFREAQILEELGENCSQIPTLYAYFCEEEKYYLVQEYIEGKNLSQMGIISSEKCFNLLSSLLETLKYIHSKNIIHQDIKPENIIIRDSDGLPVLIDFGAVKETMGSFNTSSGATVSSVMIGTKGFIAPEQSTGRTVFSTDLFALGLTMIYSLTGKYPIELPSNNLTGELEWQDLAQNLDLSLAKVLEKAIKMDIPSRYPTAEAMLDDLHTRENMATSTVSLEKNISPPTVVIPPVTSPVVNQPTAPISTWTEVNKLGDNSPQKKEKSSSNLVVILLVLLVGLLGSLLGFFIIQNMNQTQQKLAEFQREKEESEAKLQEEQARRLEEETKREEAENLRIEAEARAEISDLTQMEAVEIVDRWYQAKPEVFGRSFNTYLVGELTTGELYYNTTKSDGSVNWLINNGCYYIYDYSNIDSIIAFNNQTSRPSLTIQVSEKLALNGSSSAGCNGKYKIYSTSVIYWFEKENAQWKIYNYEVQ